MENELNLIAYNVLGEESRKVCKLLGFNPDNLRCCICKKEITPEEVGMFVKYKKNKEILCSSMGCVAQFIAEERPDLIGGAKK